MPDRELGLEPTTGLTGHVTPGLGSGECVETIADPNPVSNLPYDIRTTPLGEPTFSGIWPSEPSFERAVTAPIPTLQLADTFLGSKCDSTRFEQMLEPSLPRHPFSDVAQGQGALEHTQGTNFTCNGSLANHESGKHPLRPTTKPDGTPSNSRKRPAEDMSLHASKRHRSCMNSFGNISASCNCSGTSPCNAGPGNIIFAGASGSTTSYESNTTPGPVVPDFQYSLSDGVVTTDNNNLASSPSTSTRIVPPTSLEPHTRVEYNSSSKTFSSSPRTEVYKQVFVIKTTLSFIGGRQETTYDHHTWIRRLTRKPRKITDVTSLLVNDALVSKKTRYPRVRNH